MNSVSPENFARYVMPLLAVACLGASVLSGQYFLKEFQYSVARLQSAERVSVFMLSGSPDLPLSARARRKMLTSCVIAMHNLQFRFGPEPFRSALADNCARFASDTLSSGAKLAEAWTVLAEVAVLQGRHRDALDAIRSSRAAAPTDHWLTARRVEMSVQLLQAGATLRPDELIGDLGILLVSQRGLETVVDLYLGVPELRDAIVASTGTMSSTRRAHFLNRLKADLKS